MDEVLGAFRNREHALIEAAPGIGKTIGYLVPAVLFAKAEQTPVIISTYSTLLQQQIMSKDLPLLERMFPWLGQSRYFKREITLSVPAEV